MLNFNKFYCFIAGLFLLFSVSAFAQQVGYVKISALDKYNVTIAGDKMKQIKTDAGGRQIAGAVYFDKPITTQETKHQASACNLFQQALLTSFDVKDRKEVQEKLSSANLGSFADELDFVIILSDISFDKSYKVSQYNKKQFLWSTEYTIPVDLGREYFFRGITLNGRILKVKDNTLLGSFILDFVPCSEGQGCPFGLRKAASGSLLTNLNTKQILLSEIDITDISMGEFLKDAASVISKFLKNSIQ